MDVIDPELEEELRNIEREYAEFYDDSAAEGIYDAKVKDMIEDGKHRLIINLNDLRKKFPKRVVGLLQSASRDIGCAQRALKTVVSGINSDYARQIEEFVVGFEGSFGRRHVNPRTLKSLYLGNVVCCEGIITKCSLVRPKVVKSVHYCPNTKKTVEKRYTDLTSLEGYPSSAAYPTEDENHNPYQTEFGLSSYKDHQTFSIQELPESAPAGQLPRSVDVISDDDLADLCMPGDRVRVVGIYRCLPSKQNGVTSGTFRTILIANNVQILSKEVQETYTKEDMRKIAKFARSKQSIFDIVARSLAPSICGHDEVKQAILCLLLGGHEKILANGTRLRGDINILLIGDPSVAKSQLLRYVLNIAPRAIAATGRGSSGVGLTAAVTTDPDTGERRLEAGAMVLGDRGIVCIDEFDKMSDADRTAIHEVMEQGRVSIAKAGIHAKLNARCSVLAAANPVFGRYDNSKGPMENTGMQDSLLSRFDLIFVLLDEHNTERDTAIGEHVIKMHRYRAAGEEDGAVLELGSTMQTLTTEDLEEEAKHTLMVEEENKAWLPPSAANQKLVTPLFMRKFLAVARLMKPVLTDEAAAYIAEKYADLRQFDDKQNDKERTMPVTARTLETMIRISTAFAKSRLSKKITQEDAERAYYLLCYACFKEKPKERREKESAATKRRRARNGDSDNEDSSDESEAEEDEITESQPKSKKSKSDDVYSFDGDDDTSGLMNLGSKSQDKSISSDRMQMFKKLVNRMFNDKRKELVPLKEAVSDIQSNAGIRKFSEGEIQAALEKMSDDNEIMIADDNIILI